MNFSRNKSNKQLTNKSSEPRPSNNSNKTKHKSSSLGAPPAINQLQIDLNNALALLNVAQKARPVILNLTQNASDDALLAAYNASLDVNKQVQVAFKQMSAKYYNYLNSLNDYTASDCGQIDDIRSGSFGSFNTTDLSRQNVVMNAMSAEINLINNYLVFPAKQAIEVAKIKTKAKNKTTAIKGLVDVLGVEKSYDVVGEDIWEAIDQECSYRK